MNFQVADWYVDTDTNRIHNDEQDIKLESKVMSLLIYLAQNQGSVISREQLEANVWTDRVISYDALTSCITRLRKVLGDDSRDPAYIETVPKKGYRLIAPVRWMDTVHVAEIKASDQGESLQEAVEKKPFPKAYLISLIMLLSVVAIIVLTPKPVVTDGTDAIMQAPSIIVLPFDNLSDSSSQRYFSEGITADISIALSKLSGLRVIAPISVLADNTESDPATGLPAVYNKKLARYILSGSVQRASNKLRVNVTLIDNQTHQHLWAESYDREITEVFQLQDDITAKIVTTLSIKLTEEEKKRVAHRYTSSIEAYDQFLRGQAFYTRHTSNENLLAREHLQQAIQLDPNFARAYGTLALTYIDEYRYRWSSDTKNPLLKTLELAEKAVSIDESLPQAYWAVAYAQLHLHRYDQATDAINTALSVMPNYADGYAILALIKIYQGDSTQGIKMIRQAMRLNPDYPAQYMSVLAQAYYYLGEYESGFTILRDAIDKNFSLLSAHIMLTATLSKAGIDEEANWTAGQLLTISPEFTVSDVARIFPIKDKQQLDDIIQQLHKAGLK